MPVTQRLRSDAGERGYLRVALIARLHQHVELQHEWFVDSVFVFVLQRVNNSFSPLHSPYPSLFQLCSVCSKPYARAIRMAFSCCSLWKFVRQIDEQNFCQDRAFWNRAPHCGHGTSSTIGTLSSVCSFAISTQNNKGINLIWPAAATAGLPVDCSTVGKGLE